MYFILAMPKLHGCAGFSLAAVSGGYSRCGEWASRHGGLSYCRAGSLDPLGFSSCGVGSRPQAQ